MLKGKGHYYQNYTQHINWNISSNASNTLSLPKHRWTTKYYSDFCGVGTILKLWKLKHHLSCPRCTIRNVKTISHVLTYTADPTKVACDNVFSTLCLWLSSLHAVLGIDILLSHQLIPWRHSHDLAHISLNYPGMDSLLLVQDNIGGDSFMHGYLSNEWAIIQQRF